MVAFGEPLGFHFVQHDITLCYVSKDNLHFYLE